MAQGTLNIETASGTRMGIATVSIANVESGADPCRGGSVKASLFHGSKPAISPNDSVFGLDFIAQMLE